MQNEIIRLNAEKRFFQIGDKFTDNGQYGFMAETLEIIETGIYSNAHSFNGEYYAKAKVTGLHGYKSERLIHPYQIENGQYLRK